MIRLTNQHGSYLAHILQKLINEEVICGTDVYEWTGTPPMPLADQDEAIVLTMLREITDQLEHGPQQSADLMDLVADQLMQLDVRNVLAGDTLDVLRAALLSPREISRLKTDLATKRCCGRCGHPFEPGEVATIGLDTITATCFSCKPPQTIACASCRKQTVPLPKSISKRLTQAQCRDCMHNAEAPPPTEDPQQPTITAWNPPAFTLETQATPTPTWIQNPANINTGPAAEPIGIWRVGNTLDEVVPIIDWEVAHDLEEVDE